MSARTKIRRTIRGHEAPDASFSPGPWDYAPDGDEAYITIPHRRAGRQHIRCIPEDSSVADAEDYANARLMSASPELFRELQKAHRFLRKHGYRMDGIDAALNKAQPGSAG